MLAQKRKVEGAEQNQQPRVRGVGGGHQLAFTKALLRRDLHSLCVSTRYEEAPEMSFVDADHCPCAELADVARVETPAAKGATHTFYTETLKQSRSTDDHRKQVEPRGKDQHCHCHCHQKGVRQAGGVSRMHTKVTLNTDSSSVDHNDSFRWLGFLDKNALMGEGRPFPMSPNHAACSTTFKMSRETHARYEELKEEEAYSSNGLLSDGMPTDQAAVAAHQENQKSGLEQAQRSICLQKSQSPSSQGKRRLSPIYLIRQAKKLRARNQLSLLGKTRSAKLLKNLEQAQLPTQQAQADEQPRLDAPMIAQEIKNFTDQSGLRESTQRSTAEARSKSDPNGASTRELIKKTSR